MRLTSAGIRALIAYRKAVKDAEHLFDDVLDTVNIDSYTEMTVKSHLKNARGLVPSSQLVEEGVEK